MEDLWIFFFLLEGGGCGEIKCDRVLQIVENWSVQKRGLIPWMDTLLSRVTYSCGFS